MRVKQRTGKTRRQTEFGDFQTPLDFSRRVCQLLAEQGIEPRSVLEPTCGRGSFLVASLEQFSAIGKAVGIEINRDSVEAARSAVAGLRNGNRVEVRQDDFFGMEWPEILDSLPEPILIIGNPPWVTNSELGAICSSNLPVKSNFQNHRGIEAITGKANFDISEWILTKCLELVRGRRAVLAMLCKAAVARKVLLQCWKTGRDPGRTDMYIIDSQKLFEAAVNGCLLVVDSSVISGHSSCRIYDSIDGRDPSSVFGYLDGALIANIGSYKRWKHLAGTERYKWRSGIKHDCVRIMEFREEAGGFRNRMGEIVQLEPLYLYPMLKSSDLANIHDVSVTTAYENPHGSPDQSSPLRKKGDKGDLKVHANNRTPSRWMLVTQRSVGADTGEIKESAPKTWEYLCRHGSLLDRRASAIYKKRPRFSVFGVGDYSFASWKVAVSGLYKKLVFKVVGPFRGRPVVLDDTCYFVACRSKDEAELVARLLNSPIAAEFFSAFVFRDAKRPITAEILRRLDIVALAKELRIERRDMEDLERKAD